MALHFDRSEYLLRQKKLIDILEKNSLEGMLLFSQESMYYLTGFDSIGYVFFQCMYFGSDGRFFLLTRAPDLRQAEHTSIIEDIRIWVDGPDTDPARELARGVAEMGPQVRRLGVEWAAYGITAAVGQKVCTAFDGLCELADASQLVPMLRAIKSPAEIVFVRKAAALGDDALEQAINMARPGVFEGDILASMHSAILQGDGDEASIEMIIGSGRDALLSRPFSGRRQLSAQDQLTIEFGASYRRYHAVNMRTILMGQASARHRYLHETAVEATQACLEAFRPERPLADVFDAFLRVSQKAGLEKHRYNACGYSLGATFPPNWMDQPMLYRGNSTLCKPNMVFFLNIVFVDSDSGTAMCPSQTILTTETGCERLSRVPIDLVVKD